MKVVISLTTTPHKINNLEPLLSSLLNQTVRVDMISLNVTPETNKLLPKSTKDVCNVYEVGRNLWRWDQVS